MVILERQILMRMFDAAVAAAQPAVCLPPYLPPAPIGRTIVVGAGKGSAEMARVLEQHWHGNLEGLVVTRYGFSVPCNSIRVVEAAHPVPDSRGEAAAWEILRLVEGLTPDDLVIILLCGGGSALLSAPAGDLTLDDKIAVNQALLASGAPISVMNTIRKHLSAIKGGRLAAAAYPARIVTLAISDIPGDDPALIASGPSVPDPTTAEDALRLIADFIVPDKVRAHLTHPIAETPKPNDACFQNCETHLIATPRQSLEAAAEIAKQAGYVVEYLGDDLEGEAADVARIHAELARKAKSGTVLLSGGELTVTLRGAGRGGPNSEYMLALAHHLNAAPNIYAPNIYAMACDTDGIDGSEHNAGAYIDPTTLDRATQRNLQADEYLKDNNAFSYFDALGDLVITGATQTNVNDFRAILIV